MAWVVFLLLSSAYAAYTSITLTINEDSTFDMAANECVVAAISISSDTDDSVLETTVTATEDNALSYIAITIPEYSGTDYYNSPSVIFSSNSTCWDDADDVGTAGLISSTDESEGGVGPMVEDLSSAGGNATVISTIPSLSCELHKGTYYFIVKSTKDTPVTLSSGPQDGCGPDDSILTIPAISTEFLFSSTIKFIVTVLVIFLLCGLCGCLAVTYYYCCMTSQRRQQMQDDASQGVGIEHQTAEQAQEMVVQGLPAQEAQEVVVQGHIEDIQNMVVQSHVVEDSQPIGATTNILHYPPSAVEVPHAIVLDAQDQSEDEV